MGQEGGLEDVALRRPRRQPRRRPDALDVEHHARQFRVVGEAGKLPHQRDAGARRGRHRTCARPAGADDHADRGNLVFRLDDGKCRLAGGPGRSRYFFKYLISVSGSEEDGVIGYHATTVTPAIMQPSAAAALPSIRIMAGGLVQRLDPDTGPA